MRALRPFVAAAIVPIFLLAAVVAVPGCDSGTEQPQQAAGTGGNAVAPGGSGGAPPLETSSTTCAPCLSSKCPVQAGICAESARCLECVGMAPFPEIACFTDDATLDISECVCTVCNSECGGVPCGSLPCVRCLAQECAIEYDACSRKPSCSPCTLPDPPPSCGSEPLAVALYLCSIQHCKADCGADPTQPSGSGNGGAGGSN